MSEVTIDTGPLKGAMLQSKDGAEVGFFGGIPYAPASRRRASVASATGA